MPNDDLAQRAWVTRTLGFEFAEVPMVDRRAIWVDARDDVDRQITALQGNLADYDDEDLQFLAEFGLMGVLSGVNVKLLAALHEDGAGPAAQQAKAAERLRDAIAAYRSELDGNEVIGLLDESPFPVTLSIRATLGAALDEMQRSLEP